MSAHRSTSSPGMIIIVDGNFEVVGRTPCAGTGEALGERRAVEAVGLRREEQRQPSIADLGCERDVLRSLGTEVDRDVGAERMQRGLQRLSQARAAAQRHLVLLADELDRLLASDDRSDDRDVLAGAGEWLRVGLAVPTLDDLRAGRAETEDDAALGQVIKGHRGHRSRGGCACRHLDDARTELQPRRVRAPPREWRERVGAVGLRRPERVEAEPLGLLDRFERPRGRSRSPVPRAVAELHAGDPTPGPLAGSTNGRASDSATAVFVTWPPAVFTPWARAGSAIASRGPARATSRTYGSVAFVSA